MKRILIASLYSICTVIAPVSKADTAKKTTPTSTSHTPSKATAGTRPVASGTSSAKKSTSSSAKKPTSSAKGNTAAGKTSSSASGKAVHTNSKHGRNVQVAGARRPSYQSAPSPERYQQIQQSLADRGFYKGELNGVWGAESQDAMKRFQESQNLPDDGKITSKALIGLGLGPSHGTPPSEVQPGAAQPASTQPGATAPPTGTPQSGTPSTPPVNPPQQVPPR
jgi:Putative peptidoglycan binding domain